MSIIERIPADEDVTTKGRRAFRIVGTPSQWIVWGCVALFFVFLAGVIVSVLVNSFGTSWFDAWLPEGYTTRWYAEAWDEFDLGQVIFVTLEVALAVIVLSVLLGVPASYVLARKNFPGKKALYAVFLLPVLMPPITYGIPLATALYQAGLAGTLAGVIAANLVPAVPFVIMTMTPFIEQINPSVESAARMSGASTLNVFTRVLAPLLIPGILASCVLVLVRTVGMFELTFLTSGPTSNTLVVKLYYAMNAAGIRAQQSVDAMAVVYMAVMLVILVIALRFVNPTQLVARVRDESLE
ncbi:MAG: ABC transporter permease [Propionibacteriaceae bacterium]|jgi:putative spermidine/putrescine transport system permease protein|nr:ABC transporter permease [Propionibacteriaceae bacterium]